MSTIESKKDGYEKLNESTLKIVKVEEDSVIVKVEGWRMRIYFENNADKSQYHVGKDIEVKHYGNINKPHEVRFNKIK